MKVQKPRAWKWSEWKWPKGNYRDEGVNIFIDGNYFALFIYLFIGNEKSYIKFQRAERDKYSIYVSVKSQWCYTTTTNNNNKRAFMYGRVKIKIYLIIYMMPK